MSDATRTHHDPLDAVIADYLEQVESGAVPDREALLAAHPELADRLRAFFADFDRIDRQAAELHLSDDPNRTLDPVEPSPDLPRVRYFGDYELLEVIARGGMGVVYKARQVSLNRVVALKMLLAGELATERDAARFQAEAEAAAALDHPHIVPIYEVGIHEGRHYFSMKYVEGGPLSRSPRGDARAEAEHVAVIARAVHFAHQRGVLHRDLKPSNVLINNLGTPFVADFGLAKRSDIDHSLSESGAVVGTPRYMSPEQAAGHKDLTVAADIYSLGVLLYERLTGTTPFAGNNALDVMRQLRDSDPPRPSSIQPGLNRDLETIVLRCLEKEPAKRYASGEALADDLERWLRDEPILARPVGLAERAWRWCRRNPVVSGLSAAVAVVTFAGLVAVLNEKRQVQQQRDELRYTLYASQMNLVQRAFEADNIGQATEILERQKPVRGEPDLRGFEWHYWRRLRHANRTIVLEDRKPSILANAQMVFSPNCEFLAGVTDDLGQGLPPSLAIWDVASGKLNHSIPLPSRCEPSSPAFSPDSRRVAVVSTDRIWPEQGAMKTRIQLFEAATGKEMLSIEIGGAASRLSFTPDGRRLAAVVTTRRNPELQAIRFFDVETGRELHLIDVPAGGSGRLAFRPDGVQMSLLTKKRLGPKMYDPISISIRAWDVTTGRVLFTADLASPESASLWSLGGDAPESHIYEHAIAYSLDGTQIAVVDGHGTELRLCNAATGEVLRRVRICPGLDRDEGWGSSLCFHRDGNKLAIGGTWGGTATVLSKRFQGFVRTTIPAYTGPTFALACGPDSSQLLTAGRESQHFAIKTWSQPPSDIHLRWLGFLAMSRDGTMHAGLEDTDSGKGRALVIRETDTERVVQSIALEQPTQTLRVRRGKNTEVLWQDEAAFSPDNKYLVVPATDQGPDEGRSRTYLKIVDVVTGHTVRTIPIGNGIPDSIRTRFSDNGHRMVAYISLPPSERGPTLPVGQKTVGRVARLAAWDFQDGRVLASITVSTGEWAVSPDGTKLSAPSPQDGNLRIWDAAAGTEILAIPESTAAWAVAFSSDNQRLAVPVSTHGERVSLVRIVSVTTGRELRIVECPLGIVNQLAFSPDGKRLAIGFERENRDEHELVIWDTEHWRELLTLELPTSGSRNRLMFTRDGQKLILPNSDDGPRIWDATPLPDE